jgi:Xaa-Pro aminopeptidase/Xaa-Pro dipeptidase
LGGFRIDDTIVIGDDAAEVLTKTPKTLEYATLD